MRESLAAGHEALTLMVRDPDSGDGGIASCSLDAPSPHEAAGGAPFALEIMRNKDRELHYRLVTTRPLDRETVPSFTVRIVCNDRGDPQLSSEAVVTVGVEDANDSPPLFASELSVVELPEEEPPGTPIRPLLLVTDADTGAEHTQMAAKVFDCSPPAAPDATWQLPESRPNWNFCGPNTLISPAHGCSRVSSHVRAALTPDGKHVELVSLVKFDRETRSNYSFLLVVQDPSKPEFCSPTRVVRFQ